MIARIVEAKTYYGGLAVFLINRLKNKAIGVNQVGLGIIGYSLFVRHLLRPAQPTGAGFSLSASHSAIGNQSNEFEGILL